MLALAAHGCRHIQLDEPVMMRFGMTCNDESNMVKCPSSYIASRYPEDAMEFGVKNSALVFAGCPDYVERTVHFYLVDFINTITITIIITITISQAIVGSPLLWLPRQARAN